MAVIDFNARQYYVRGIGRRGGGGGGGGGGRNNPILKVTYVL